jgi:hypothetical protein
LVQAAQRLVVPEPVVMQPRLWHWLSEVHSAPAGNLGRHLLPVGGPMLLQYCARGHWLSSLHALHTLPRQIPLLQARLRPQGLDSASLGWHWLGAGGREPQNLLLAQSASELHLPPPVEAASRRQAPSQLTPDSALALHWKRSVRAASTSQKLPPEQSASPLQLPHTGGAAEWLEERQRPLWQAALRSQAEPRGNPGVQEYLRGKKPSDQ